MDRRQPEQPGRSGARDSRPNRDLARHERHALRPAQGAACRSVGREPRLRRSHRRLHGAGVLQERVARAGTRPGRVRPRLGRFHAGAARDAADAAANVRAVIEGQMMATAIHAGWIGERMTAIYATGGAARNRAILQVMADVHGTDVYPLEVTESAALGPARPP